MKLPADDRSVWRPLVSVVEDAPLTLCDRRSVQRADFMPFDRVMSDRVGEMMYLTHSPTHQWYWMSKQTPDEPVLFITWDSQTDQDRDVNCKFCLAWPYVEGPLS